MHASLLRAERSKSTLHLVLALCVVVFGARTVGTSWSILFFPLVVAGVCVASGAFGRLLRLRAAEQRLLEQARADFGREFRRSTLPQQIYWLLLAVAETDGEASAAERELVRAFVRDRVMRPDLARFESWPDARVDAQQAPLLAASLRAVVSRAEAETIFFWACLVAFADGHFNAVEHEILHQIARGLGIDAMHARRTFLHAKHTHLGGGWSRRAGTNGRRPTAPPSVDTHRARAFEILGLDATATPDQIRQRHRELAKAHHPDRHQHLGPTAAKEAAARFREVQAAYELLTATGTSR